jgi:hypothetical protein
MRVPVNPHFNANQGGYSRNASLVVYDRMGAKSAMIVNDHELPPLILARGGVPILRMGAPEDDDLDARGIDPVAYADAMHNTLASAEIAAGVKIGTSVAHIGNEIGSSEPDRTGRWFNVVVRRMNYHQRPTCILNAAVLNPSDNFVRRAFPYFIDAVRENELNELGFHEGLFIDPNNGTRHDTLPKALASGAIGGFRKFIQIFGVRVRITEFAASLTPNDGYLNWIGTAAFAKLCDDCAAGVYRDVEFHPFTAFKWDRGKGFEYADNVAYPSKEPNLLNYQTHNWGKPVQRGKVLSSASINVRSRPSSDGTTILGVVKNGDIVTYWTTPYQSSPYRWYRIVWNNEALGYVAEVANLQFENLDVEPQPSTGLTALEYQRLKDISIELANFTEEVKPSSSGTTFQRSLF